MIAKRVCRGGWAVTLKSARSRGEDVDIGSFRYKAALLAQLCPESWWADVHRAVLAHARQNGGAY